MAAGAVVQPGAVVPAGELWAGNPARKLRDVKPNEADYLSTVSRDSVTSTIPPGGPIYTRPSSMRPHTRSCQSTSLADACLPQARLAICESFLM